MRRIEAASILSPSDLDLLQGCLDHILASRGIARATPEGETVAKALIAAFQSGISDREQLIRLADIGSG